MTTRHFFRYCWLPFYRIWAAKQALRERTFEYAGLHITVPPGVFHPLLFFSTPIFISFLQTVDFEKKNVLDLGTGSGLLGLFAAKKGGIVTALDINPLAVDTACRNALTNQLELKALESDLFDNLSARVFDIIVINPPFYPRSPRAIAEYAFFAGAEFEYFEKLFAQLPAYRNQDTQIWMILSEDCDLTRLIGIAHHHGFDFRLVFERKKWGERFWVIHIFALNQTVEK